MLGKWKSRQSRWSVRALVSVLMDRSDDLQEQWRRRGDVEAAVVGHKAIVEGLGRRVGACDNLVP